MKTGLGEQHSEVLPDRSIVEVNTQSEIRIAFTDAERRVELVRGEAFFDVAKDPARAFVVTVAEGRVLVLDRHASAGESAGVAEREDGVEVIPGTQAEARPGHRVQMRRANVVSTFAWRERRLVFDGEPLAAVVEEFNRYNSPPLTIGGTNITDKRYITTGQPQFAGGVVFGTYNAPREWYAPLAAKF